MVTYNLRLIQQEIDNIFLDNKDLYNRFENLLDENRALLNRQISRFSALFEDSSKNEKLNLPKKLDNREITILFKEELKSKIFYLAAKKVATDEKFDILHNMFDIMDANLFREFIAVDLLKVIYFYLSDDNK